MDTQDNNVPADVKNENAAVPAAAETAPAAAPAPEGGEAAASAEGGNKPKGKIFVPPPGSRAAHIREALEILYDKFPKCFIREGDIKPLKVGILDDLKKLVPEMEGMTTSKLRAAVRLYCTRLRYLYAVREGVPRIDLEGNEVENVSEEHAKYAKERFGEVKELRKKKKEEEAKKAAQAAEKRGKRPFNKHGKKPFNKQGGKFPPRGGQQRRFGGRPNSSYRPAAPGAEGAEGQAQEPRMRRPMVRVNAPAQVRRTGVGTRSMGVPATEADLKVGTTVLVNNNNHFMRGTVSGAPKQGTVNVQLTTGITMSLPVSKVLLPNRPAARSDKQ